jgi:D-alanyl-D-alanine carboxypeptidase
MKRGALAVVALAIAGASAHAQTPELPGPTLLFNPFSGEVISQTRAGEPWYPASLTKLMTAYVIFKKIKDGKLKLDQQLTISDLAHSQPASHTGLAAGQTVTVDFALQALLVYSANDMAYVLAEGADGSIDEFAKEMNAVAHDMGLQASHFVNPNGLFDPRHISSARDLGVIAALIINQFPEHLHYFNQEAVQVGKRKLANHNSLIRIMPEAVGMKTGFICNSGYNLVGSAVRGGKQLVSVVLGAKGGAQRAAASKTMLDEGFDQLGKPEHGKIGDIVDQPYGQIVPADMTTIVCKQKDPVAPVNAHHLHDFGISFGTYDTALKADAALRGRLISPTGIDAGGEAGVIKLDNGAGYVAMLWGLTQLNSMELCSQYRAEDAPCDVMPDSLLQQMAATAPSEEDTSAAPADEGSDTSATAGDVKASPAADAPPAKPVLKAKHRHHLVRKGKKKKH